MSLAFVKKLSQLTQKNSKFREITIRFKPAQPLSDDADVMIMGNFNGYIPSLMERYTEQEALHDKLDPKEVSDSYFFRTQVLKGFTYRFYFSVSGSDNFILDESQPKSVNHFGRQTNIISVPLVDPSDHPDDSAFAEE